MSYNTRRTGGGRGAPTTQVNYHQQTMRAAGVPAQSRNPGYTTTQQGNYNSVSSQSSYATQPNYTTTPQDKATQPKATAAQSQPPPAAGQPTQTPQPQPSTPQPSTPQTVTPKQEPLTPADTPSTTMDTTENGDGAPRRFWKKKPLVKVSNKIRRARQNAKLRRVLNPKNALTFLNELRPGGIKFVVREDPSWGYVASVDIDGKNFSGHALSVSKAKVQASEQALKHLLLEQLSKSQAAASASAQAADNKETSEYPQTDTADKEEAMETNEKDEEGETKLKKTKIEHPEDDLPWGSLAAFALHKLFAEWQKDGTEPAQVPPQVTKYEEDFGDEAYYTRRPGPGPDFGYPRRFGPASPYTRGRGGFPPYAPRGPPPPGFGLPRRPLPPAATFLGTNRAPLPLRANAPVSIMPMKKIPEDANKRHPVMILNQLKPNVIYNESREGEPPQVFFVISVELDGKTYVGRGKSKKDAKMKAAKAALVPLGVIYEDNDEK